MDKLDSIRVFLQVARLGNFSNAAENLGISKAMASKHIHNLEEILGVRLLNRTTRHTSLTEAGVAYRDRIRMILDEMEETELAVSKMSSEPRGTLKLASLPSFGSFHLTRAIADYREMYKSVSFELFFTERTPDIVEEGLDLAICIGELEDSSVVARKLAHTRVVVCGAPDYLEKFGTPETPDDLVRHNCMVFTSWSPAGEWLFTGDKGTYSVKVHGDLRSNIADSLRIAAIKGCGLAQLPTYVIGLDVNAGRLKVVLEPFEQPGWPIYAVYQHRQLLSAKVRTFVDFLHERYHPVPYWETWGDS